jgi:hypothetical protein
VFTAVVRVSGAGRLADFRERLRWLMVRDAQAEDYTEHHAEGRLEYRFEPRRGIPFPAFTVASAEFPELKVEAEWRHDDVQGRALIENGRLVEQSSAHAGEAGVAIQLAGDAELALAMVCVEAEGACVGYAASAERHTYFRLLNNEALELLGVEAAQDTLEDLAFSFIDEWLWFDEATGEEAAIQRARYAGYGYPVRGANVKAHKLALLRELRGSYCTLDNLGRKARAALEKQWLNPQ